MNVLMINGSPHKNGNTAKALSEMQKVFEANGTLMSFLHRLFYSTHFDKRMKVGAAIAAARRGGLTAWRCHNPQYIIMQLHS